MTAHQPDRDTDAALSALLESAYGERVDVDVAARHLWRIHRAAGALRVEGRRTRKALVSVLAGGMLFMSSGGALAASSGSLPGDTLYSVKRGVEVARIVLTVSREGDARLHLARAERRMAEVRAARAKRPEVVPKLVREAQDSLDTAERMGGTRVVAEARETAVRLDVLVAVLDESAAAIVNNRKALPAQTEIAMVPSTPPATPGASPEASPSEDTSKLASESSSPSASPSASSSPTASESPSAASETPTATSSPSESESASASPTPTQTSSPGETSSPGGTTSPSPTASEPTPTPTPTSSPSRKYESVEPSEAPTGTTSTVEPTPTAQPTS